MRSKQSGFTVVELIVALVPVTLIVLVIWVAAHFINKHW